MLQRVGLDGRRRVVQSVRVVRGLSRQRAGVGQRSRSAVTEKPIVPYKFYIVPLVAFFDAVNTDGVPICCITGVTSVEVVHGVAGVAGDLVEALPSAHCFLNGILVIQNLIIFHGDVDPRGQKQASEAIVEDLVALQCGCGVVSDFNTCSEAVKNAVLAEYRVAVGADQHSGLRVSENVVFFQQTSASVEDADASISAVMNLVSSQRGVAVSLDPHPRHGIIKDLIVLDEAQSCCIKHQG